jgi:hypothetical protein
VRVRCHPDKSATPVELAQILNQDADRVSRLLLEPLQLYAKHAVYKTITIPSWAEQFEAELLSASVGCETARHSSAPSLLTAAASTRCWRRGRRGGGNSRKPANVLPGRAPRT